MSSWVEYQANLNEKYMPVLHYISSFESNSYKKLHYRATSPFISRFTSADWLCASFQNFILHYWKKKICHQFSFFNGFTQLLNNSFTYSHNSQNPISVKKCVFLCSVIQDHQTQLSKKHFFCREICFLTLNYLNYLNQQTRYFSKFCSVI